MDGNISICHLRYLNTFSSFPKDGETFLSYRRSIGEFYSSLGPLTSGRRKNFGFDIINVIKEYSRNRILEPIDQVDLLGWFSTKECVMNLN